MLSKKNRLRKKKEFNFIYKKGKSFYSKFLTLFIVETKLNISKFGFSISNKVGNSVVRHKIKRVISEIIREKLDSLPTYNYIIVARKGCENLDFVELKNNIEYLFKKANIV